MRDAVVESILADPDAKRILVGRARLRCGVPCLEIVAPEGRTPAVLAALAGGEAKRVMDAPDGERLLPHLSEAGYELCRALRDRALGKAVSE